MFEIVKQAKLQPAEIAHWFKAHRVSVSMWLNGRGTPHHLRKEHVIKVLKLIESAVEAGDLPLPTHTSRRERRRKIDSALINHKKTRRDGAL